MPSNTKNQKSISPEPLMLQPNYGQGGSLDMLELLNLLNQGQSQRQDAIISALNRPRQSNITQSFADSPEGRARRGLAAWHANNPGAAPSMPENPFGRGAYADSQMQGVVDARNNYRNTMNGQPTLVDPQSDKLFNPNFLGQQKSGKGNAPDGLGGLSLEIPDLGGFAAGTDGVPGWETANDAWKLGDFKGGGAASAPVGALYDMNSPRLPQTDKGKPVVPPTPVAPPVGLGAAAQAIELNGPNMQINPAGVVPAAPTHWSGVGPTVADSYKNMLNFHKSGWHDFGSLWNQLFTGTDRPEYNSFRLDDFFRDGLLVPGQRVRK